MADLTAAVAPPSLIAPPGGAQSAAELAKRGQIRQTAEKFEASFLSIMLQQMFQGRFGSHIGGDGEGAAAQVLNFLGCGGHLRSAARAGNHVGAGLCQAKSNRSSDSRTAADNHCCFSVQFQARIAHKSLSPVQHRAVQLPVDARRLATGQHDQQQY